MLLHLGMVFIGLIMVGFGLWAIHYRMGFLKKTGGIIAPFGLLITILGALLMAVPGFFSSSLKDIIDIFFK
jgi:NO-binding membrane sensor protein with MHYT domain